MELCFHLNLIGIEEKIENIKSNAVRQYLSRLETRFRTDANLQILFLTSVIISFFIRKENNGQTIHRMVRVMCVRLE